MQIFSSFSGFLVFFNNYVTDYLSVVLLLGSGVYFTFKTRFVQVRCFCDGIKMLCNGLVSGRKKEKVTSFAALATAVGAQVGTGNIVGAAAAILIGGPGAVFWMWVSAFFGMATVYAEAVAAQKTRISIGKNEYVGGPVFYIKKAFGDKTGKFLAGVFALFAVLTLGFSGAMVQSNAVCGALWESFSVPPLITGILLATLSLSVFSGGLVRITKISEKLVVGMTLIFLLISCYVLIINLRLIPSAFNLIVKSAFIPNSAIGGGVGTALKITIGQGVKKGIFSNEAGMGTTPHVHASADAKTPHTQGVFAMMGVFIDTFVILTLTALIMIVVLYTPEGCERLGVALDMNNMMLLSLTENFGSGASKLILSFSLLFFGFSSIIAWNYFGKVNAEYLWGEKSLKFYYLFSAIFVFLGSVFDSGFVWQITDAMNLFLIIPNVIALFKLQNKPDINKK